MLITDWRSNKITDCLKLRNAEYVQRVKCGIFRMQHSTFYTCTIFRIPQSAFHILPVPQNYAAFSHGNLAVKTLSKIVSTIQDSANGISANTFLSRDKCLECLPPPFMYSYQTICKTQYSCINWTCGKLSHIFLSATFNSETVFSFGWRFQIRFMCRSSDTISTFHSNLESY